MKKILAMILAMAMILSLSVTAFATESTYEDGTWTPENGNSQSVSVTTALTPAEAPVYKVVVSWDSLTFTYTAGAAQVWDPDTHTYDTATEGSWSDAVTITVSNHSNASVYVSGEYVETSAVDGVDISLASPDNAEITRALENTEYNEAPSADFELSATGVPTTAVTNQVVGTVTITISTTAPTTTE